MITATFKLVLSPKRRAEALRTLRSVQGPCSAQPGCIDCHILRDTQDDEVLLYIEEWGSREQLKNHLRSERYRKLLEVVEWSKEPPDIRFDTVSRREGIELVAAARTAAVNT